MELGDKAAVSGAIIIMGKRIPKVSFCSFRSDQDVAHCPIPKGNSCFWPSVEDEIQTVTPFKRNFAYYLTIQAKNIIGTESVTVKVPTQYKGTSMYNSTRFAPVVAWLHCYCSCCFQSLFNFVILKKFSVSQMELSCVLLLCNMIKWMSLLT
jgi:hypothetical protein